MLNHLTNSFGDFVWHQIRYPNHSTLVVAFGENLYRRVMVNEGRAASRPRVSARFIVDVDDEFMHDHSVCKGDDSRITFESTVYYEPRDQTFMDSAHITDRVPNKFFISLDFDFFVNSSHSSC